MATVFSRSKCPRCAEEYAQRHAHVATKAQTDSTRIERMTTFRNVKHVEASKDQSALIGILLGTEARDITRSMLELSTEVLDDMFGKILYHDVLLQLELSYACQYEEARMRGYRKQFATFIQSRQNTRDGSTLDESKTVQSVFSFSAKGSRGLRLELTPNEQHAAWNDPDADTDYTMLFDTARDVRWDEEHEKRAEAWQRRNGI